VTGRPLPNTFYAKFDDGNPAGFFTICAEIIWPLPLNAYWVGALLYVVGIVALVRRGGVVRWALLLAPWLFLLGVALSRRMPPHCLSYYYWLRYAVPGLPFLYIPAGAGWTLLWQVGSQAAPSGKRPAPPPPRTWTKHAARAAAAVLVGLSLIAAAPRLQSQRVQYAWNCQNMNEVQVELGRWVAANVPAHAAVAVIDAGAIRYFGQRRTIDLIGLNFHRLAGDNQTLSQIFGSAAAMREFMRARAADYLIIFPAMFPRTEEGSRLFHQVHGAASPHYTVAPARQDVMVVLTPAAP
jgi:hypothetical protein